MTQNINTFSYWFVTDDCRAKAQIKYELRHLESRLNKHLDVRSEFAYCPEQVNSLCLILANRYLDYLKLIHVNHTIVFSELSLADQSINWSEYLNLICKLRHQLSKTIDLSEEARIISEIATLYYRCGKSIRSPQLPAESCFEGQEPFDVLKKLFKVDNLKSWLLSLVTIWNEACAHNQEATMEFQHWSLSQQQLALRFISEPKLVVLVNSIFFYKLYPEKLFDELIHPEKLVSVRMRLGLLYEYIERLQKKLFRIAQQNGLKAGVDLFFHGDDLPQGIIIEENEVFREIIQDAIKRLNVKFTPENEEQATLERLHDLGRSYKFWFNPNRLIDAVMVLQQRLVKIDEQQADNLSIFHREMLILYRKLTTTECLDLYGYFANNDSRYLLYTLFTIIQGFPLDWLPSISCMEKNAIERVFLALQCVMEALREELKNRHVTTAAYVYDLAKQQVHARRRNRDAVFRIIAIYGRNTITISDSVEQLFSAIEESTALKKAVES